MKNLTIPFLAGFALALCACSSQSDNTAAGNSAAGNSAAGNAAQREAMVPQAPIDTPAPTSPSPADATPDTAPSPTPSPRARTLTLDGLGALKIGQPLPKGTSWAVRGAQISDQCLAVSSPDYPGVYAIAEGGKVRRITLGERSDVKLAEGIGVGASEKQVRAAFGGFREEPHVYVAPPGKYLTAPNAASGEPALRFEIGEDGKVSLIHVGTMPVLAYVEGCA